MSNPSYPDGIGEPISDRSITAILVEADDYFATKEMIKALKADLGVAKDALDLIMKNLGVPQPGYPAPVAHAYELAKEALEFIKEKSS